MLASHRCDIALIPGLACEMVMFSPSRTGGFPLGFSGVLPNEDHTNISANENDLYKLNNWFRNHCRIISFILNIITTI